MRFLVIIAIIIFIVALLVVFQSGHGYNQTQEGFMGDQFGGSRSSSHQSRFSGRSNISQGSPSKGSTSASSKVSHYASTSPYHGHGHHHYHSGNWYNRYTYPWYHPNYWFPWYTTPNYIVSPSYDSCDIYARSQCDSAIFPDRCYANYYDRCRYGL